MTLTYTDIWSAAIPVDRRLTTCLFARGFLLDDEETDVLSLSDNIHGWDRKDFPQVLRLAGLDGAADRFEEDRSVPTQLVTAELSAQTEDQLLTGFEAILGWNERYREEAGTTVDWSTFVERRHGWKVPARKLDADIAIFAKALSAAGVCTSTACSGHGKRSPYVTVGSPFDDLWANWLADLFEPKRHTLRSRRNGGLRMRARDDLMETLFPIAAAVYANRVRLRQIRRDAIDETLARLGDNPGASTESLFACVLSELDEGAVRLELQQA